MDQNKKPTHPLLARVSIPVNIPENMTEKELEARLHELGLAGSWTGAQYTQGPNGTVVDIPAGWDIP